MLARFCIRHREYCISAYGEQPFVVDIDGQMIPANGAARLLLLNLAGACGYSLPKTREQTQNQETGAHRANSLTRRYGSGALSRKCSGANRASAPVTIP